MGTLGEIVNDIGGGTWSGRPVRAVQVGGLVEDRARVEIEATAIVPE